MLQALLYAGISFCDVIFKDKLQLRLWKMFVAFKCLFRYCFFLYITEFFLKKYLKSYEFALATCLRWNEKKKHELINKFIRIYTRDYFTLVFNCTRRIWQLWLNSLRSSDKCLIVSNFMASQRVGEVNKWQFYSSVQLY